MKDYVAKQERELAARLLREALSAEPDFTEEGNARICADRFARAVLDCGGSQLVVGHTGALLSVPLCGKSLT